MPGVGVGLYPVGSWLVGMGSVCKAVALSGLLGGALGYAALPRRIAFGSLCSPEASAQVLGPWRCRSGLDVHAIHFNGIHHLIIGLLA